MGFNRTLMGHAVSYSPLPLASAYSSVLGATAVTLALTAREMEAGSSQQGDHIEVPLAAGLCESLVYNSMHVENLPERYRCMREYEISRRKAAGIKCNMSQAQVKELLDPFFHTYTCGDGRPLYLVAPSHAVHQVRTLQALGIWQEFAEALPEGNPWEDSQSWGKETKTILGVYPLTDPELVGRLKDRMREAFLAKPAAEWDTILGVAKVPAAATQTLQEWINSDHALASGLVTERFDQERGVTVREGGPTVWWRSNETDEATRAEGRRRAQEALKKPEAGEPPSNAGSCGTSADVSPGLAALGSRAWLAGLTVVDLCDVIAGPTIGGYLARFGATVLKVNPVESKYDPLIDAYLGLPANRGKRSLLANVKKGEAGQELLHRLIGVADVVLCNQSRVQLEALGVGEAAVKAINPHAVLLHFDAFGGPREGPRSNYLGYDDNVQACTGIMARFGGGLDTAEEHAHIGMIDVVAGFAGTLSVVLALFKRLRTGQADVARTSLAACSGLLQAPYMYDYQGRAGFTEPSGPHVQGEHALYRYYATRDGHVFVAAALDSQQKGYPTALEAMSKHVGRECQGLTEDELAEVVAGSIQGLSTPNAVSSLRAQGIPCVEMNTMANLRQEHGIEQVPGDLGKHSYLFHRDVSHPLGQPVTLFLPCAIRSEQAKQDAAAQVNMLGGQPTSIDDIVLRAPKYGAHTDEVLRDWLGYTEEERAALREGGIVASSYSTQYLPGGDPWKPIEKEYERFVRTRMLKVSVVAALMAGTLRGCILNMRENMREHSQIKQNVNEYTGQATGVAATAAPVKMPAAFNVGRRSAMRLGLEEMADETVSALCCGMAADQRAEAAPPAEVRILTMDVDVSLSCKRGLSSLDPLDNSLGPEAELLWSKRQRTGEAGEAEEWRTRYSAYAKGEA